MRYCVFVLAGVLQVVSSQGPPSYLRGPPGGPPSGFRPEKCAVPPPDVENPQNCCQLTPLFSEEDLTECGFKKINDNSDYKQQQGPLDCNKQLCLLKSKGFLKDDQSINLASMKDNMDKWLENNPGFDDAVAAAKEICMGENGPPGPPQICEANRLMICTGAIIFSECPTWRNTDQCTTLKKHMDECKNYLPQ